jgi:thiol-disulfide isomerase/thioredoxin
MPPSIADGGPFPRGPVAVRDRMSATLRLFLSFLLASGLSGCTPPGSSSVPPGSSPEIASGTSESSEPITVTLADRAVYDQVVGQHAGRVVLVDFWATWCLPCVQQFPHTVALSQQYGPERLAVVSVSMDEPQDRDKVLHYLKQQQATFDNLISEYGIGQKGFDAFEITDGAIPHYKVYDRTGTLRHVGSSNEGIDQILEQLLAEERI